MQKIFLAMTVFAIQMSHAQNTFPIPSGNVGIGTLNPQTELDVIGHGRFRVSDDKSGIGGLSIETNSGTNLRMGGNFNYSWIQSHMSLPLYINELGNNTIFNLVGGSIGVGTASPMAKLQVNNGDNSYGTILATSSEVNFSLYTKSLTTQSIYGEAFRLGLKYSGDEGNGFISFYRGPSANGGFLGFSTNGIERMKIDVNGNVGIGTNSPIGLLDVKKTSLNAGGQAVLNIIGSTWAGDGASLILNQLWNDRYYKTIIDNNGSNYGQVGSGLKIKTSYWNGSDVSAITALTLIPTGNLGIGSLNPRNKLDVNGTIHSKEVKVDMDWGWPDFVFKKEYKLPRLEEVEKYIAEKGHLENIPSEEEVLKNGINLGEMNAKLLQKIEELTLYAIEQDKKNSQLADEIENFKSQIQILKKEKETLSSVLERLSKLEQKLN